MRGASFLGGQSLRSGKACLSVREDWGKPAVVPLQRVVRIIRRRDHPREFHGAEGFFFRAGNGCQIGLTLHRVVTYVSRSRIIPFGVKISWIQQMFSNLCIRFAHLRLHKA